MQSSQHNRRLELELQHLKNQLFSEQTALIECQEEKEKAERLLNAICNALNDSTTASADVVATLQLSVYRYKDAYVAIHGGVSPALMELVNDVEQGVERLNESTRSTQERLSSEDVQVSATEALGNGRVGSVEMDAYSNNSLSRGNSGSVGPSPYKGFNGSGSMDGSYTSMSGRGGEGFNSNTSESQEIKRLKSQLASLKRTYEEEKQRLEHSHKEHLSTLAVALQRDTEKVESRAIEAESKVAELDLISASLRAEVEMLKNSISSSSSSSLPFNAVNDIIIDESKTEDGGTNDDDDDDTAYSRQKQQEQVLLTSASSIVSPRHPASLPLHTSSSSSSKPVRVSSSSTTTSHVPLSVAGLATVEVLSQLSDAMAKLRPLPPLYSPEGMDTSPRPARSRIASPPPMSTFRNISAASLRLPELAGINDTLASLKAQIEDLEKNTHLVMPDLGSPTYATHGGSRQKANTAYTPTPTAASVDPLLPLPPPTPQSAGFKSPLPPPPPHSLSSSLTSDNSSSSSASRQRLEMEQWQLRSARRERELRDELDKEAEVESSLRTQIRADAEVEATLRSQLKVENDIESSLRDQVRSERQVVASVRTQLQEEEKIEASLRTQLSSAHEELQSNADVVASLRQELTDRVEVEASLRSLLGEAHAQTASVEETLKETKEALYAVEIELSERRRQVDEARMNAAMAAEASLLERDQLKKGLEATISELRASSEDLTTQVRLAQSLLIECQSKLDEQKELASKELNESDRVKRELSASQEALSAAFRDMASVDANLSSALESVSLQTSRAETAEKKCASLSEDKNKLISMVEEALVERDRLVQELSIVKADLALALVKKVTVDTSDGGIQESGFPKDAAVGPEWSDPNEMRVAAGDSSAVMALAEGGGGVGDVSSGGVYNKVSQQMSAGDLRVTAYDDTPALRSLVNELRSQATSLEVEVSELRFKLSDALAVGENASSQKASLEISVASLELSVKRHVAREEELSLQIANIRKELASAHEAVSSAEKRAVDSEMSVERVSSKIASYQREAETSAMEARVAQEQLTMYLLRQPSGHLSSSSSSSLIGGGGLLKEVVNEEILQQQRNEIARLEKALDAASSRAREEADRVAALTSQGLEQHRLLQRARAEANLKSADVDAHLEGLVASEARARAESNEAKKAADIARDERASVIRILETVLTDVPKAIYAVLGVRISPETLQSGESSISFLLSQSSIINKIRSTETNATSSSLSSLPALPPTPFSVSKGGSSSGGGGGVHESVLINQSRNSIAATNTNTSNINEDDLAREMHAAASQLRLVTLQKAAMAKELTQVYKAVEVLEGNLGRTRKENSKLLATLTAVQSSKRSNGEEDDEEGGGGYGDATETKVDNLMVLPVSLIKSRGLRQQALSSARGDMKVVAEDDILQDGAAMLAETSSNSSFVLQDAPPYSDQYKRGKNGVISKGVATALTSVFSSYLSSSHHGDVGELDPLQQHHQSSSSSSLLMSPAGPFTTRGHGQGAAESARLKALSTRTLTAKRG